MSPLVKIYNYISTITPQVTYNIKLYIYLLYYSLLTTRFKYQTKAQRKLKDVQSDEGGKNLKEERENPDFPMDQLLLPAKPVNI